MDWGSLAGLVLALSAILLGQMLEGGQVSSLVQPAAFAIVFIGTLGAVILQSGLKNFVAGVGMARLVFMPVPDEQRQMASNISLWSATARREGLLALERYMEAITDPFTERGLRLIVDGIDPHKLRQILDLEISAYEMDRRQAVKVWESAGGYAPTIGILGAVIGLIHVMENLSDPSRLGNGIAVAFVATVYGVGLANLIFLPIGSKLKAMVSREILQRDMLADAFAGIATGDNPRVIYERMAIYQR
ncbi:MAG: flagellar motor protein [Herminiimonas sp.]|nr:flagellar motor protein [Herminiimonas sp.]